MGREERERERAHPHGSERLESSTLQRCCDQYFFTNNGRKWPLDLSIDSKNSPYTTCGAANSKQLKLSGAFTEPGFLRKRCWRPKTAKIDFFPGQLKNKYMFFSVCWNYCSYKNQWKVETSRGRKYLRVYRPNFTVCKRHIKIIKTIRKRH